MLANHNFYNNNKSPNIISDRCLNLDENDAGIARMSYSGSMDIKETLIQATSSSTGLLVDFSLLPNQWESIRTVDGNDYTLLSVAKSYSKDSSSDGYRDSRIFTTSKSIPRAGCNCLKIHGCTWHDYGTVGELTHKVYIKVTDAPLDDVTVNTQYDFSKWTQIASSTRPSECDVAAPIETESDNIYINIGLYHGTEVSAYTVWFGIKDLYLAQFYYI